MSSDRDPDISVRSSIIRQLRYRLHFSNRNVARGQSSVIGVALLLGITVVAISALTASTGALVADGVAAADTTRVSADLHQVFEPHNDRRTTKTRLSRGTVSVRNRSIRLLAEGDDIVWSGHAGALVYRGGSRTLTAFAGAIIRQDRQTATMPGESRITVSPDALYLGVPVLNASGADAVSTSGHRLVVSFRTAARSNRIIFPTAVYKLAIETATPEIWEQHLHERGAETITRRDIDHDGTVSLIAAFDDARRVYIVVHDVQLTVAVGQ
jgi:flagellin-like protein